MIHDQLVEFEIESKEGVTIWQTILEKVDIIPIGVCIVLWIYQKIQTFLKYGGQLLEEDDLIFLIILSLPIIFWWLYSRHIKFGWFLRSTFYLFVSTIIIRNLLINSNYGLFAWIVFGFLLIASATVVVNSFRQVHLQRLKIDAIILTFALMVDIGIILAIFLYSFGQ